MNKTKIVGIVGGVVVIVAAALVTAFGISKKNNLYKNGIVYEMPMETEMSAGMPAADNFSTEAGESVMSYETDGRQMAKNLKVSSAPFPAESDKKIIKNGSLTMKVGRVAEAQEKISAIAKANGGDIFSSNINQTKDNVKSGSLVVKVPVGNFEKTFEEIKNTAALVVRESTSGTDVTEEYQDLQSQIKNKQAEEQAYARILDQTGKMDDILAVTRQLSMVRGEIERLEGRIRFMNSQTDMSLISINLSEDQEITVTDSWRPLQIAKEAVNSLVKSVQGFLSFLIVLVITFIPVAILYLLVIFIIYFVGKKIYRKFRKNKENIPSSM